MAEMTVRTLRERRNAKMDRDLEALMQGDAVECRMRERLIDHQFSHHDWIPATIVLADDTQICVTFANGDRHVFPRGFGMVRPMVVAQE